MTVKELKETIANLPDDMEIFVELDADYPYNGCTSDEITIEPFNGILYINAKYNNL